jgi:hypothetical protein
MKRQEHTVTIEQQAADAVARQSTSLVPERWQGQTYAELVTMAPVSMGADLEKGAALMGVPFAAIRATFRPGDYIRIDTGDTGDYVSLDIVVGDSAAIALGVRRGRIEPQIAELLVPEERLVFNEAGTGVYRQVVQFLELTGRIQLPSGPLDGPFGRCRFDTPVKEWRTDGSCETRVSAAGESSVAFDIILVCPRGLRQSEYENEYTKQGVTRYIA